MNPPTQCLILLSGGIDSTACLALYKGLGYDTTAMFIDYGQPTRIRERDSAIAIARHYTSRLATIKCEGPRSDFSGEIMGRNVFLLSTSLLFTEVEHGIIACGIHGGSSFYDCQNEFVTAISQIVKGYSNGRIVLGVPFLTWSKRMIWNFSNERHVPLNLTWSCEVGPTIPCGQCLSCQDLEVLNAGSK